MELTTQKPKLILTDLDGTLLRDDKTLSPANRAALERAAGQGAQVVLSTGRSYKSLSQELRDLPFLRYFILVNGAKVYDLQTDTVLYRAEVPMDVAQGLFQMFEPLDACIDCYQNDTGLMDRKYYDHLERYIDDPHALKMTQDCRTPLDHFREAVRAGGESVQKLQAFFHTPEARTEALRQLGEAYPQLILSSSLPGNLEINAPGATKGDALLALCRALGLAPACAVAFGDGTNDMTMIRSAGIGVAMANAEPEVLAVADLVAPSNQEDGVAQVLSRWF